MSSIKSYMDNKQLRYSVTVGRRTFKGFQQPFDALKKGIEAAIENDPRAIDLVAGKPFDRQVGIIFGADVRDRYCDQN